MLKPRLLLTLAVMTLAVAAGPIPPHLSTSGIGESLRPPASPSSSSDSGSIWNSLHAIAESVARPGPSGKAPHVSPPPSPSSSSSSGSRFFPMRSFEEGLPLGTGPRQGGAGPSMAGEGAAPGSRARSGIPKPLSEYWAREKERRYRVNLHAKQAGWMTPAKRAELRAAGVASEPLVDANGRELSKYEYAKLGGYVHERATRPNRYGVTPAMLRQGREALAERKRAEGYVPKGTLIKRVERGRLGLKVEHPDIKARKPWKELTAGGKYTRIALARERQLGKPLRKPVDPVERAERQKQARIFLARHGISKDAPRDVVFPHPESTMRPVSIKEQTIHQIKVRQALYDIKTTGMGGPRPFDFDRLGAATMHEQMRRMEAMLKRQRGSEAGPADEAAGTSQRQPTEGPRPSHQGSRPSGSSQRPPATAPMLPQPPATIAPRPSTSLAAGGVGTSRGPPTAPPKRPHRPSEVAPSPAPPSTSSSQPPRPQPPTVAVTRPQDDARARFWAKARERLQATEEAPQPRPAKQPRRQARGGDSS